MPEENRLQQSEEPVDSPIDNERPLAGPVRGKPEEKATQAQAEQQDSSQVEGRKAEKSMADEQDNPGIRVPPPLIYVVPLILGLLLDRRVHIPLFLPPA